MPDKPSLGELAAPAAELRAARYQVALDMQGLLLSGLVTRLSGAPVRVGWDRNREGNALFLTHPVVPGKARRSASGMRWTCCTASPRRWALTRRPASSRRSRIWPPKGVQAAAVAVRPAAPAHRAERRRVARLQALAGGDWAQLAQALAAAGHGVVFVGDKHGRRRPSAQITPSLPPAAPCWTCRARRPCANWPPSWRPATCW